MTMKESLVNGGPWVCKYSLHEFNLWIKSWLVLALSKICLTPDSYQLESSPSCSFQEPVSLASADDFYEDDDDSVKDKSYHPDEDDGSDDQSLIDDVNNNITSIIFQFECCLTFVFMYFPALLLDRLNKNYEKTFL